MPGQFRLRIFKVNLKSLTIDIVIHVEDLIKTMSSQVEHLFRFQILK